MLAEETEVLWLIVFNNAEGEPCHENTLFGVSDQV